MDILLSTDRNYIMPTGVTMKSICNNNVDVTFHVLIDRGVSEHQKHQLENVLDKNKKQKLLFYCVDSHFLEHFPSLGKVKSYITKATYYRLFVDEFLPNNVKKIIYLDGDIIVLKSLEGLWNMDISDYAVGAVTDMAEDIHDFNRLGYDKEFGYFNAGVLLINIDYWRKHNLRKNFMDLILNDSQRIVLHDQDVLNITLYNQKINLPMKYNVQNGFLWKEEYNQFGNKFEIYKNDLKNAILNPIILHFTDNKKPWHTEDCNPLGYLWYKYFKQTEWKYVPLGHCNKSKVRYWGAKILRRLGMLKPAVTDEKKYLSLTELTY